MKMLWCWQEVCAGGGGRFVSKLPIIHHPQYYILSAKWPYKSEVSYIYIPAIETIEYNVKYMVNIMRINNTLRPSRISLR